MSMLRKPLQIIDAQEATHRYNNDQECYQWLKEITTNGPILFLHAISLSYKSSKYDLQCIKNQMAKLLDEWIEDMAKTACNSIEYTLQNGTKRIFILQSFMLDCTYHDKQGRQSQSHIHIHQPCTRTASPISPAYSHWPSGVWVKTYNPFYISYPRLLSIRFIGYDVEDASHVAVDRNTVPSEQQIESIQWPLFCVRSGISSFFSNKARKQFPYPDELHSEILLPPILINKPIV